MIYLYNPRKLTLGDFHPCNCCQFSLCCCCLIGLGPSIASSCSLTSLKVGMFSCSHVFTGTCSGDFHLTSVTERKYFSYARRPCLQCQCQCPKNGWTKVQKKRLYWMIINNKQYQKGQQDRFPLRCSATEFQASSCLAQTCFKIEEVFPKLKWGIELKFKIWWMQYAILKKSR